MKRSKFYQFFPPPEFLKMPAIGLDISDTTMRFVELIETHKGLVIGRFGERAIPRGIIESGEVKKPADLRTTLSEIKKQFGLEFVSVSLPEERAYFFDVHLPIIKYDEIRGALELELEEHIPLKVDEALFDYEIEKEVSTGIHTNVSAVPRSLIDGYLEAFSGTGITPTSFEVEAQSVARAIIPAGDKDSYMIVDFGKTRTGVTIVSNEMVQFTSTVSVGGSALTDVIAKNLGVSYEEAEKVKREKGITGVSDNDGLYLALVSTVSILRDNITKANVYWQTHDDYGKKRLPVKKIYLCGGDSNLSGFVGYLSQGLNIQVELANVMINVNSLDLYVPEIKFSDSLSYATAIGLALRHSR